MDERLLRSGVFSLNARHRPGVAPLSSWIRTHQSAQPSAMLAKLNPFVANDTVGQKRTPPMRPFPKPKVIAQTITAVVVAFLLWLAVGAATHAVFFILERLRGIEQGWFQSTARQTVSAIAGTYAGLWCSLAWFSAANIKWTFYGLSAAVIGSIAAPSAVLAFAGAESNQRASEWLYVGASLVAGLFISKRLQAQRDESTARKAYWEAQRPALLESLNRSASEKPNKAPTTTAVTSPVAQEPRQP